MEKNKVIYEKFQSMESKTWFRFMKVFSILVFVSVIIFGSIIIWDEKPYKIIDNEKSYIKCDRDTGNDLIYFLEKNGWSQYDGIYNSLGYYRTKNDDSIRNICRRPLKDEITGEVEWYYTGQEGISSEYKVNLVYKVQGNYLIFIGNYIMFYIISVLLFFTFKEMFFYIAIGKKMFKNIAFYKHNL